MASILSSDSYYPNVYQYLCEHLKHDPHYDVHGLLKELQYNCMTAFEIAFHDPLVLNTFALIIMCYTLPTKETSRAKFERVFKKFDEDNFFRSIQKANRVYPIAGLDTMNVRDFANEKFLGGGAYGTVYSALHKGEDRYVAIKKIRTGCNRIVNKSDLLREVNMLQQAQHPCVVTILGVVDIPNSNEIWIVTELLNGGSLRDYCTGSKRDQLNARQKILITFQCSIALEYLHSRKIKHKDIKPENVVISILPSGLFIAKLCDFGLAKPITVDQTHETTICGTWMHMAPEFTNSKADSKKARVNSKKADMYALGTTMCELFTNLHFWHLPNSKAMETCQIMFKLTMANDVINRSDYSFDSASDSDRFGPGAIALSTCSECPDILKDILRRAVAFDRGRRPQASELAKCALCEYSDRYFR